MKSDPLLRLYDLNTWPQRVFICIERCRINVRVGLFLNFISECGSYPHKYLNSFLLIVRATPYTRCTPRWCEILLFIVFILFNEKLLLCKLRLQFLLFLSQQILLHVVPVKTQYIDFTWVFFKRGRDIRVKNVDCCGFGTLRSFACYFHDYFELIIH